MRCYPIRLILATLPLAAAMLTGCVARVETDPAPAPSRIEVVPDKAVDVDVDVKRTP